MLQLATALAVALYLVPVAVWVAARARRDRALLWVAFDVPFAVALDLLAVMALARVVRLETAILISRPAWLVGGGVAMWRRRPSWPAALGPVALCTMGAAALAGIALSLHLSQRYSIWDRDWHIPLVPSLLGQTIPFANVFDPNHPLHYHFSGDVLAGMFQTLSFGVLHAERALSVAHDVCFGFLGLCVAALLLACGYRRPWTVLLSTVAVLLSGPAAVLHRNKFYPELGYALLNFTTMSFRPHTCLAALMFVAWVAALVSRVRKMPAFPALSLLVACTALLAVSDETSVAVLGVALGFLWLVFPELLHEQRKWGLVTFAVLAVAVALPNWWFGATASSSETMMSLEWVNGRTPGVFVSRNPDLPHHTWFGIRTLLIDFSSEIGVLALLGVLALGRRRAPELRPLYGFGLLLFVLGWLGVSHVEINHKPIESHRFATVGMFLLPLFGVLLLAGRRLSPAVVAMAAVLGLGAFSTVRWLRSPIDCFVYPISRGYQTDCRVETGARLGERPRPEYVAQSVWALYAGCHPLFAPGRAPPAQWTLKTLGPLHGPKAWEELDEHLLAATDWLPVECPLVRDGDRVCDFARRHTACEKRGGAILHCELSGWDRTVLRNSDEP